MSKLKEKIKKFKELPYKSKTSFTNKITMISNLLWACLKLCLAYIISSVFIALSGFYTIFIALAKSAYFDGRRNAKSLPEEKKYYKRIAFGVLMAGISYLLYFIEIFNNPKDTSYGLIISICIATIAFCEIVFSIRGIIKSKKTNDFLLTGLKFINLASALSSIVLTHIALLSLEFTIQETIYYNTAFGSLIGFFIVGIAIYMFISARYHINKIYPLLKCKKVLYRCKDKLKAKLIWINNYEN